MDPLAWAARRGPYVLIAGLVVGIALPPLAAVFRPLMPVMVVLLLFVSVLRMEPRSVLGSLRDLPSAVLAVLILQLAVPLLALGMLAILGLAGSPGGLALLLMLAAPSIVGSPNICMMMGAAPVPALRVMVTGTALLPLTVLPVFWSVPSLGGTGPVLIAALRLFAVIALTTGVAMLVRRLILPAPSAATLTRMDGASAVALAVFVLGLMEAVNNGIRTVPGTTALWVALACGANFGAQLLTWRLTRNRTPHDRAVALSVIAGNRNISLYFVSLPPEVIAPVLVFIGCYQIPMYLTPLVMRRLYQKDDP